MREQRQHLIDKNTVIPISLLITIIACTIHATVMYARMTAKIDRLTNQAVLITDMERWVAEFKERNPGVHPPDMFEIMIKGRNLQ